MLRENNYSIKDRDHFWRLQWPGSAVVVAILHKIDWSDRVSHPLQFKLYETAMLCKWDSLIMNSPPQAQDRRFMQNEIHRPGGSFQIAPLMYVLGDLRTSIVFTWRSLCQYCSHVRNLLSIIHHSFFRTNVIHPPLISPCVCVKQDRAGLVNIGASY